MCTRTAGASTAAPLCMRCACQVDAMDAWMDERISRLDYLGRPAVFPRFLVPRGV